MSQSLRDKTVNGVGWSAVDAFLSQGVSFIVGLVLARILSPSEYGLIGIVAIFTTIMLNVVDSGLSNAIIRKRDASDDDYSTLFYCNLIISLLMFILLYISSPWIASFFNRPQLIALCRVMGLLLVFQALSIVQYTILSRKIDFRTKARASIISAIVSGVIGIGMALSGFGVWALVAQQLSRQLLYSLCLWILNKWWPKLQFSIDSFKYMWGFGWKILLSGLLNSIWDQLYDTVVGKCYSPSTLGQYTRSSQYAGIFSSNLTSIVQRVSYPVLSQVQDDKEHLVSAFRRVIKTTMFVTVIVMISMGAVSEPLIYCLIGSKWHDAALYLPLICISMSTYPLHAINLNMLQVQGRTDIYLYIEIVKKIITIGPLCLGIFVSIYWMLIGRILAGIINFFLNSYYTGKSLGYSSWMQLKDVAPSYGISLIVALSVYFLKYIPVSSWIILPLQVIVGACVLFFICETIKLEEYCEVKKMTKGYILKLKKKKNNE